MSERQFQLELNDWFSSKVEYEGWGIAEFSNPEGRIEGKIRVVYDEFDKPHVRMEVDGLPKDRNNNTVVSDLTAFFNGLTHEVYSKTTMTYLVPQATVNSCKSLTVETVDGIFTAVDIGLGYEYGFFHDSTVTFHPLVAKYKSNNTQIMKYLVLPLANFLTASKLLYRPKTDQHPLLMYRIPTFPSDLTEIEQENVNLLMSYSRKSFIPFSYNETLAFIEFLPDSKDREDLLKGKEKSSLITAVLVVELGDQKLDIDNWRELALLDIHPLLSVATGRYVGSPWIELRDENGVLTERLHTSIARARFRKGPPALGIAASNDSICQLLTQVVQKNIPYAERGYLNAAISQLVLGGYFENDGNIEDKLSHLFRAIDALWHFKKGEPKPSSALDNETMEQVKEIINSAKQDIETLKVEAAFPNASPEANALHKVQQQLINISMDKSPTKFTTKLGWLLIEHQLKDAEILDRYYKTQVTGKSGTWLDNVNKHRNDIMHEGWFNWRDDGPDIHELKALVYHLRDIGIRILLKTIGYSGEYTPSIFHLQGSKRSLDWVQPNTTPAELGYNLT